MASVVMMVVILLTWPISDAMISALGLIMMVGSGVESGDVTDDDLVRLPVSLAEGAGTPAKPVVESGQSRMPDLLLVRIDGLAVVVPKVIPRLPVVLVQAAIYAVIGRAVVRYNGRVVRRPLA